MLTSSVALLFLPTDSSTPLPVDSDASAAVTAASAFDRLPNGVKYNYSTPSNASTTSSYTVNASAAWGTATNPYVINTVNQWQLFINLINANNTTYNSSTVYYVLGADLSLSDMAPVGTSSSGFKGTLFGNKHTITVGAFNSATYAAEKTSVRMGLFDRLVGAKIYDLAVNWATKTITNATATTCTSYVGGLAVQCDNTTVVTGVTTSLTVNRNDTKTSATVTGTSFVGGLVAHAVGGTFYKCSSTVTNTFKKATGGNTSTLYIGGIAASTAAGTLKVSSCATNVTATGYGTRWMAGGVVGYAHASLIMQFENIAARSNYSKYSVAGTALNINSTTEDSSCDIGSVIGWTGDVVYTTEHASYFNNIYTFGSMPGQLCGVTGGPYCAFALKSTNIYVCGAVPANTQWGTAYNVCANTTVDANSQTTANRANANGNISSFFTIDTSTGAFTNKSLAGSATSTTAYTISYAVGAGASWGGSSSAPTTYTYKTSAQSITAGVSTAPTRAGYTFKGWTLSGTATTGTVGSYSIPASSKGNLIVYATWELNALSGSASASNAVARKEAV
ncbi:MAG: InlB B-repeat-containing protein [Corallococcus sp.]|nr:InlB B-repeat-containing protein [Corallococcus sp.]